ncbi:MAG: ABC transporter substrate-binding protein [Hyphomicrobiales bacterium]
MDGKDEAAKILGWASGKRTGVRLSRREFIQHAVAAGITVAAAESLYSQAARAEPKKGGTIKAALGNGATTDSLDPTTWGTNFFTTELGTLTSDQLVAIDQTNSIVPRLAEEVTSEAGATKWIFRLREGVTFKNGKILQPADVIASINAHRSETSKSGSKAALKAVSEIKADGDNVIVTLNSGNADFPYALASYRMSIFPGRPDGTMDYESGGCGAFSVTNFDPGVRLQATRNPDFWDAANVYFDEVELLVIADPAARTNVLLTGDVHYIDRVDLRTIDLLKAKPELEIDNVTGSSHLIVTMMTNQAPFDNNDVRMAIKYAINREELMEKVLYNYGTLGNDNPMSPTLKFAIDPEPRHSYDPAKAKEYLKKAGLDGLKLDLSASDAAFAGALDAAQLIKEQAAKAGIEINIVNEAADSYWDAVWMKKPFILSYWGGGATIDQIATATYAEGAAWNDTFWRNARFNELLVAARAELDETKRAQMYAELQQILHDDGGQVVWAFNNYVGAHTKALSHGKLNSNLDHDGTYMWRRWWFT